MSDNEVLEEQKTRATTTLIKILDYLGLEASLAVESKGSKISIKISSEDAGRIIGRKGQTLESLQLLLSRIMYRTDEPSAHIILDIDGYTRGSRRGPRRGGPRHSDGGGDSRDSGRNDNRGERFNNEQLEQQAQDAAKEVKRWGESVTLPKMNAHDRRIIHVTLQDDDELKTHSEGEGALKTVVVSLKKDD